MKHRLNTANSPLGKLSAKKIHDIKLMSDESESNLIKQYIPNGQPVSLVHTDTGVNYVGRLVWKIDGRYVFLNLLADALPCDVSRILYSHDRLRRKWGLKASYDNFDAEDVLLFGIIGNDFHRVKFITEAEFKATRKNLRTLKFLGYDCHTDGKTYAFGCGDVVLKAEEIESVYNVLKRMPSRDLASLKNLHREILDNTLLEQGILGIQPDNLAFILGKTKTQPTRYMKDKVTSYGSLF